MPKRITQKGAAQRTVRTTVLPPAVWQSLTFEWLWVYHGIVPRVEEWSAEITVPAGWFWVEKGQARIQADGREVIVKHGQSFFTAPGTRRQWFAAGTRLLSVGFRCQWPDGMPVFGAGLNVAPSSAKTTRLLEATHALFLAVHGRMKEVTYHNGVAVVSRSLSDWCKHETAFRHWFSVYVSTLERLGIAPQERASTQDRRLDEFLCRLNDWPLDQPLKLTQLISGSQLSTRRIHDLLRAHLGMTAQAWLERRRLEAARQRLTGEAIALKEIAFALGFRHPPHFTAWFKRHTGMTPTAFRTGRGVEGA
jgi:AraC-like DNA-binding protein